MRELERQLGRMDEAGRREVVGALRAVIAGAQRLSGRLGLSGKATVRLLGSLSIAMSQGKTARDLATQAKAKARAVGPHVESIFAAL